MTLTVSGSARPLEDFSRWLDGVADDEAPGDADPTAGPDWRDLFAELAALRQEIRLQNREQSKAGRELMQAAARHDEAVALMRHRDRDLTAFETRVAHAAENHCLRSFLEVHDALGRGLEAAERLQERSGWPWRRPRGVRGVVEGYEIALRRFDRVLARFGVTRIQTIGEVFDARTMHAAEMRKDTRVGDGIVVDELLSGYARDGGVLRLADVAVNRTNIQE